MITKEFLTSAYSQETDEAIIILLEISSDDLTAETMFLTDTPVEKYADMGENIYGVTSNEQRYLFAPFAFTLPQDDKTGVVTAKLSIQNIDRSIVPFVRSIRNKIKISCKVVLSSTPDVVELSYDDFELKNVEYNAFTISGNLSYAYLDDEPFPVGRFNPSNFPGLF